MIEVVAMVIGGICLGYIIGRKHGYLIAEHEFRTWLERRETYEEKL